MENFSPIEPWRGKAAALVGKTISLFFIVPIEFPPEVSKMPAISSE